MRLNLFVFLLNQATQFGIGLLAVLLTLLVLIRRDRAETAWLLVLPALWVSPLVVAAFFAEKDQSPKTAGWFGWVALAALVGFVLAGATLVVRLKGRRWLAAGLWLANAPFAVFGAMVVGMAASGTWL